MSRSWQDHDLQKGLWELLTPKAAPAHDCEQDEMGTGSRHVPPSLFSKASSMIFFHTAFQAVRKKERKKQQLVIRETNGRNPERKYLNYQSSALGRL